MDLLAGAIELIAKWIVGNKNRYGFVLHLISGLLWSYIAFTTKIYGLLIITLPSIIINIRNFLKWRINE